MSLNKQQLEAVNQANFPDNNSKFITPELLREFNTDMIDAIQLTGSYATTGSNTFVGNQTITGNLSVSGVISASVLYVQTETASVIYSSGSNQLGDELTDIQTLSGSVKIQGQLLINGVPLTSGSTTDTGSLVTTASFNAYTQSTDLRLNSLETNSASVNVSISNLNGTTASLNTSVTALNQFTQSQAALNGTFATTGSNTFTGNQIIDRASKLYTNGIYWTDVTAGFNNLEIINQGGGNLDLAALNGGKVRIVNTPLVLTGSALSSSNDISTSANIYGANLTGSTLPAGVISSSAQITSLGFVSSSVTASSLITASFDNGTRNLTFTKGDNTTFAVNIPDVSGSTINTGSFITTGSASTGSQTILGDFNFDTTYTGSYPITDQGAGGSNVVEVSYGEFGSDSLMLYWANNNWVGITVNGPGVTNATITSTNFGANYEVTLSSGTVTGGGTYTFSGLALQTISLTGSLESSFEIRARDTSTGQRAVMDVRGFYSQTADSSVQAGASTDGGVYTSLNTDTYNIIKLAVTSSQVLDGSGNPTPFNKPQIAVAQNNAGQFTQISFEGNGDYTNGTITVHKPLFVSSSLNVRNTFTASLQQGYVWVGDSTGKTVTVATSSFGGGGTLPSGLLSSSVTNFVDYSASVDSRINGIVTGTGFATTGSNTFTGNQTLVSSSLSLQGSGNFTMPNGFNISANSGQITNLAAANTIQFITEGAAGPGGTNDIKFINRVSGSKIIFENTQGGQGNTIEFTAGAVSFDIGARSGSTGKVTFGSNTTSIESLNTPITASAFKAGAGGINSAGALTASLQQGYVWVGGAGDVSTLVATSSFTINTGSFATTGSNTFTGDQTLIDNAGNFYTISDASGSMMLVAKGFTSASAHLSASSAGIGNFIFKTNSNTADTIISGSNNIFTNPAAPTAGFKRYIGGNSNTYLGPAAVPQISASMAFSPAMNQNNIVGVVTMRGPVSSSAYSMLQNNILGTVSIGPNATSNAEKLTSGLSMTTNNILGTLNITANQSALTGSTTTLTSNTIAGTVSLQLSSSAVSMFNNIINDAGFTFTNQFFSSSAGLGSVAVNRNNIAGQSNSIIVVGAQPTASTNATSFSDNFIGGGANILYGDIANARIVSTNAYHNAIRNIIFGNGLIVTGSSLLSDTTSFGSAFFGRWNSIDGNKDLTNETIFAVGTGTSTSARKTGFLIDSGSNTFIEGTLNVSGSLLLNGTPITSISTGSFATTGSNTFFGQQTINLSGTAQNLATQIGGNSTQVETDMYVDGGNYDTFNVFVSASNGVYLRDFDQSNLNTWLQIPTNTGNNPAPIMPRGLNVTGGGNVATTGSNVFTGANTFNNQVKFGTSTISDSFSEITFANNQSLQISTKSTSNPGGTGSFQLMSMTTGSGGQASFQMTAQISGTIGELKVTNSAGTSSVLGLADNIIFAKRQGFPNTPATTFTAEATTINLKGAVNVSGSVNFATGSNKQAGTAVLDGANPGTVTVSNSLVTANSIILVSKQTLNHSNGYVAVSAKSAGSFTITSNHNGDTDTVGWFIINNS